MASADRPLRIALLAYRGKPHCGGQGIYVRHLSKALVDLGHTVEVFGGPPYPELDERVQLTKLPSLEIYNDHFPMRQPGLWELKNWKDWLEVATFTFGTFPEPLAFTMRAWDERHPGWIRAHVHENLLAAPEAATRALLSACGLPFDAACLRFERVEREVHTASAAQVREPLRAGRSAAARYGALLDPLRIALAAHRVPTG